MTVTGAGFRSPSSSVRSSIARGAITDVTSVQNGVYRFAFVVPTCRFFAQFSMGGSSPPPPPLYGGGGGTGGESSPDFFSFVRWVRGTIRWNGVRDLLKMKLILKIILLLVKVKKMNPV